MFPMQGNQRWQISMFEQRELTSFCLPLILAIDISRYLVRIEYILSENQPVKFQLSSRSTLLQFGMIQ
jgi:hypothetical protein